MGILAQHQPDGPARADQAEQGGDYPPIPAGWIGVEIDSAEVKPNNKKTGWGLQLKTTVFGEEHNGRKVNPWINVTNPNQQCQDIGRREQCDLAAACGIPLLDDEDKLIGKRLEMKLVVVKNKQDELDNEVKGYRPLGGATPVKTTTPQNQQASKAAPDPAAPPAAGGKDPMPWEK